MHLLYVKRDWRCDNPEGLAEKSHKETGKEDE
jgi:hypothetical protein